MPSASSPAPAASESTDRAAQRSRLTTVARPKQARSEATLERILDAAERLAAERGFDAISIPEIVHAAQSSVGGFYARFRDKDELLTALEERSALQRQEALRALLSDARWGDAAFADVVEGCVRHLVGVYRERPLLTRAFMLHAARDTERRDQLLEFRRRVQQAIAAFLLPRAPAIAHPEPRLALDLAVTSAIAVMQQRLLFGELHAGGRPLDDAELTRELTRLFLSYLGLRP